MHLSIKVNGKPFVIDPTTDWSGDFISANRERALEEALRKAYADTHPEEVPIEVLNLLNPVAQGPCPTCGGSGKQPGEPQPDSFGNYTPCDNCEGGGVFPLPY